MKNMTVEDNYFVCYPAEPAYPLAPVKGWVSAQGDYTGGRAAQQRHRNRSGNALAWAYLAEIPHSSTPAKVTTTQDRAIAVCAPPWNGPNLLEGYQSAWAGADDRQQRGSDCRVRRRWRKRQNRGFHFLGRNTAVDDYVSAFENSTAPSP